MLTLEQVKENLDETASLSELQAYIELINEEHGWNIETRSFGDKIALIHSELSEALEEFRTGHDINEVYYKGTKPEGIPIELADVIIRILHLCADEDVDIQSAMKVKIAYNAGREYRHGNKAL